MMYLYSQSGWQTDMFDRQTDRHVWSIFLLESLLIVAIRWEEKKDLDIWDFVFVRNLRSRILWEDYKEYGIQNQSNTNIVLNHCPNPDFLQLYEVWWLITKIFVEEMLKAILIHGFCFHTTGKLLCSSVVKFQWCLLVFL